MIKGLLENFKTTSAGVLLMATSIIHLVFQIRASHADEGAWSIAIAGVLAGFGLLAAGDASKSKQDVKDVKEQVAQAVVTGDTSILTNPKPPGAPVPPAP